MENNQKIHRKVHGFFWKVDLKRERVRGYPTAVIFLELFTRFNLIFLSLSACLKFIMLRSLFFSIELTILLNRNKAILQ